MVVVVIAVADDERGPAGVVAAMALVVVVMAGDEVAVGLARTTVQRPYTSQSCQGLAGAIEGGSICYYVPARYLAAWHWPAWVVLLVGSTSTDSQTA